MSLSATLRRVTVVRLVRALRAVRKPLATLLPPPTRTKLRALRRRLSPPQLCAFVLLSVCTLLSLFYLLDSIAVLPLRPAAPTLRFASLSSLSSLSSSSSSSSSSKLQQQQQQQQRNAGRAIGHDGNDNDHNDDDPTRAPDPGAVDRARAVWPRRADLPQHLSEELWNRVKHDVVIGVKTGHEVAENRLRKLRDFGWWSIGRDVPNMLVLSDRDDARLGTVGVKPYGYQLVRSLDDDNDGDGSLSPASHGSSSSSSSNTTNPSNKNATVHSDSTNNINNNNNSSDTTASLHDGALAARVGIKNAKAKAKAKPRHWFEKGGWRGDKDKNLPALHVLRRVFPGKKWYLLLDDDTYIFLESFARFALQDGLDASPVYTGKVFYISRCGGFARDGTWLADRSAPRGLFAHGGSGIVLNGKAMDAVFPALAGCIRDFSACWAGDMQVGLCLRRVGVFVRRVGPRRSFERHFIPFWPSKALADRRYSQRWKSAAMEPITFHKMPDREMRLVAELERRVVATGDVVVYAELREHLLRNGVVPAHSRRDRKNKYFSSEFMPPKGGSKKPQ